MKEHLISASRMHHAGSIRSALKSRFQRAAEATGMLAADLDACTQHRFVLCVDRGLAFVPRSRQNSGNRNPSGIDWRPQRSEGRFNGAAKLDPNGEIFGLADVMSKAPCSPDANTDLSGPS